LRGYGFGPLTFAIIAACVVVFVLTRLGGNEELLRLLAITNFPFDSAGWGPLLPEIRHGEVWRALTPIFVHGDSRNLQSSLMHILFNMLWLVDLGSMIEGRQRSLQLALLVVIIGIVSNLAQAYVQFHLHHSVAFCGMSGVVYGLLGYIWLRGKFDPASGLYLHQSTVTMMLIWLVLCFTGWLGPIANTAHVVGLLSGMLWGYLSSLRYR
jgi:GlpG protein